MRPIMLALPDRPTIRPIAISNWLLAVAALVFVMVVVGGITRLTESGLSIVRWEPISGAIPPLNEADWQAQFDLYRASPQYQQVNVGMTLADFKFIFFWEYIHRLLGRLIGVAFALPLLWFAVRRAIPRGYGWKLVVLLALGGLQGAIGWWMVASGLVNDPRVSHIRLAVHLLTALVIFSGLVWVGLDLRALARSVVPRKLQIPVSGIWAFCLLFLQMLFGAYVAGLDAGYAFNTWPLMGDEIFPSATVWMEPLLRNFVDNPVVVQFVHRWLAFVVAGAVMVLGYRAMKDGLDRAASFLVLALGLQIGLGIATILSGVTLWIGVAHQGGAVVLLGAILLAAHKVAEKQAGMATLLSETATA